MKSFGHHAVLIAAMLLPVTCMANPALLEATPAQQQLAALETANDGRIGVFALNTATNQRIDYRANERFPFCSTHKAMGVAAILKKSMSDPDLMRQRITYGSEDLVSYSPETQKHIDEGMTVRELCAATMILSDNSAINLLVKKLGGPQAVNSFARSIGDHRFRLDRWEPRLNTAIPGDLRDTSTPAAMARSLRMLVLGDALAAAQREQFKTWLIANTTGDARIRAGVPRGWIVGDKTGTGDYGTNNDIGVIWPPNCAPIVITVYSTQNRREAKPRDEVVASATRIAIKDLARRDQCLKSALTSPLGGE